MKGKFRPARSVQSGCCSQPSWITILAVVSLCYFTAWMTLLSSQTCLKSVGNEGDNSIYMVERSPRSNRDGHLTDLPASNVEYLVSNSTSGNTTMVMMYDEPVNQLENTANDSKQPRVKMGSRSKSIAFLKTFKVGGTTVSSIFSALAFNSNMKLAPIDQWCRGSPFTKDGQCVDMIGTDHPKRLPCNFPRIHSDSFCNPPEVFMILRDPVDRLWSGYRHEVKIAGQTFPLKKFLDSKTSVKTPSHYLLGKNTEQALQKAESVNILLHHLYDESLVYMALKTGLKLCDIMYPPCDSAAWGATKCNQKTVVNVTDDDHVALVKEATTTGEKLFYNKFLNETEKKLKTDEITKLTTTYRALQRKALKHCQSPGVLDTVTKYMKSHPYVMQDRKGERLFHFQTEKSNPLDPLTVCMGWFCHETVPRKPPPPHRPPLAPKH